MGTDPLTMNADVYYFHTREMSVASCTCGRFVCTIHTDGIMWYAISCQTCLIAAGCEHGVFQSWSCVPWLYLERARAIIVSACPACKYRLAAVLLEIDAVCSYVGQIHAVCYTLTSVALLCGLLQLSSVASTWLILPVVICLSQRLSHACLSISFNTAKLRMAH